VETLSRAHVEDVSMSVATGAEYFQDEPVLSGAMPCENAQDASVLVATATEDPQRDVQIVSSTGTSLQQHMTINAMQRGTFQQHLQDLHLIVVGTSEKATKLAELRTAQGGRLTVLCTDKPPASEFQPGGFVWIPPSGTFTAKRSPNVSPSSDCPPPLVVDFLKKLKRRLGVSGAAPREWVKVGPDLAILHLHEEYHVAYTGEDSHACGGIRVVNATGEVSWAMSGQVVLAVTDTDDVDESCAHVSNELLNPICVPNPRWFLVWCFIYFIDVAFLGAANWGLELRDNPWKILELPKYCIPLGWVALEDGIGLSLFGFREGNIKRCANVLVLWVTFAIVFQIEFQGRHLTDPITVTIVLGIAFTLFVALHFCKHRLRPANLKWSLSCVVFSAGSMTAFFLAALVFVSVAVFIPSIAASVFPMTISITEFVLVACLDFSYRRFVYLQAGSKGYQPALLTASLIIVHTYGEACRLVGLLTATVTSKDYAWINSLIVGLLSNVLGRTGWSTRLIGKVLDWLSPGKSALLDPSLYSKVHDEVKFSAGYGRFVTVFGIAVMHLKDGHYPLWCQPVLLLCFCAFVMKIIEDCIVYFELIPRVPRMHVEAYAKLDATDPLQIYAISPEMHHQATACGEPRVARCLALHGCRRYDFVESGVYVLSSCFSVILLLQIMVGPGFVVQSCPEPFGPLQRLTHALVVERPLPC